MSGNKRAFEQIYRAYAPVLYRRLLVPMMADEDWLDKAEATWARQTASSGPHRSGSIDRGYVELIAHPFFEDVAKQMLRAEHVRTIEHGMHNRPPAQPGPQDAGAQAVAAHDAQGEVRTRCQCTTHPPLHTCLC